MSSASSSSPRTKRRATLDGGVFTGEVAGAPGSYVVLAHVDDAVAGMMYVPGQGLYRVRTTRDGSVELTEMNADLVPPEAALPTEFPADALMPASADTTGAVAQADTGNTVIDLLVAYTPATATANGGTSGVNALAAAAVATTNLAYQNSLITITLRLVGTTQVAYTESHALATDLFRLASTSDGIMDSIFASRTSVKADLVSLMVTGASDAAGVAYLWTPGNVNFASVSFSVVVDIYADANLTLAHELGHNMGANHAAPEASGGAYSYSLGWRFTGSNGIQYRTVMAYAPGIRVPYFSNPSVSYLGAPTGTSTANNALTLMNSRTTVAAFQTGLTAADQAWTPVTAGDFNADGKTDLIWRNSATGKVIAWLMNGSTTTSTTTVWNSDPTWVPIAAADFNADGKPDLIWRNSSTGKVIVWLMSGTTMTSSVTLWTGDPTWVPITAGDFNGDSKPDLVWRNSATGKVIVWLMNGTTMTSTITLWTGDAAWIPVAASDLNADGKTDLIWRNTATGRVVAWLMDGTTQVSAPALWTGAATWVPYTAGAFNADASPDLVWRNSADGRVIIWFMSGTTMSSTTAIWQ